MGTSSSVYIVADSISSFKLRALFSGSWRNPPSFMEPRGSFPGFLRHEAKCYCNLPVHTKLLHDRHVLFSTICTFLCFVDRASRYNCVKENQLDAQLTPSIFR